MWTIGLIVVFVYLVFPVAVAMAVALSPRGEPAFLGPIAYPRVISLDNLRVAIERGRALTCFANSASVACLSALMGTVLGFPAAYVLARSRSRWKPVVLSALLMVRMQPKMPAMAAYYHLVSMAGLLDNPVAVALVRGGGVLLSVWLMKAAIDGVPRSLEQAALLDGFSPWQVALRVTLPLSAPGIAAAFLLEFASAWNSFLLPLLFMSSQRRMTVSLGIDRFLSGYAVEPGPLMAFTLVVSLPLLLVFPRMLVAALAPLARGHSSERKLHW
ncbi:carbohydrate ABC transporter permease [Candidatus Fermentibacteria bacterium]|nr:carbohydrate ABC transporter permease [Candidatus Fermentibacteria bacterium]